MKTTATLVAMLATLMLLVAPSAAQERNPGSDRTVLRIGVLGAFESTSPLDEPALPDREIWNLQYATLTDRAPSNVSTQPGLAEDWETSDDRTTTTYRLRADLVWSDGRPLTAGDIAWNITTARDQRWPGMIDTVEHLDAVALDDRTLRITTSVADPRLPGLDILLVPPHIWEPVATDAGAAVAHSPVDGVGSGPFILDARDATSARMTVNPTYWGWGGRSPELEVVELVAFASADEAVRSLENGVVDALHGVPPAAFADVDDLPDVQPIVGDQGRFDALVFNGGAGSGEPHPAVLDPEVRRAIAETVDRDALVTELWSGLTEPLEVIVPAVEESWRSGVADEDRFPHDPDAARRRLEDAGYVDTDGDGVRETPDGEPLRLRLAVDAAAERHGSVAEMLGPWLGEVGVSVEIEPHAPERFQDALTAGAYDLAVTGWMPGVDPDDIISSFATGQIGGRNVANWSDPTYDELNAGQSVERNLERRLRIVREATRYLHDTAIVIPLYVTSDLQAHRTDRFEGWVRQPAGTGPVLMAPTSPTYANLRLLGERPRRDQGPDWAVLAAIGSAVVIGAFLGYRRFGRRNADPVDGGA